MDNNTCRIVGTIRKTSGAPAANETVHIVQDNIRRAWDGAALPVVQAITADGNGEVDFDLIPGHYRMVWQDATAQAQHRLYVPDAPFVWLADAAAGRESEFTPEILFLGGKRGVFLDFSDQSTLFQTDDQTTPVTAADDPIGLALDLSGNGIDMVQTVQAARGQYKTDGDVYRVQLDKVDDNYEFDFTGSGGFEATWYQPSKEGLVKGKLLIPDGVWKLARENPNYFPSDNIIGLIIVEGDVPEAMDKAIFDWWEAKGCGIDFGTVTKFTRFFFNREDVTALSAGYWDTTNTTHMDYAFLRTSIKILDVEDWDTSSLEYVGSCFQECNYLETLDVSKWDTSSLEEAFNFVTISKINALNVSGWDTSKLRVALRFSYGNTNLETVDLSSFDFSSLTDGKYLFENCSGLTTVVVAPGKAFASLVATGNLTSAFTNTNLTQQSIDGILVNLETCSVDNGIFDQSGGSAPSAIGEAAIDALRLRNWTITVTGGY